MDAKTRIKQFILDVIVAESGLSVTDIDDDESLIDSGILDSLGMLKLIAFLDEEMDTNIMAESFSLDDFATLNLICRWVGDRDETAAAAEPSVATPPQAPAAADGPHSPPGVPVSEPLTATASEQLPATARMPGIDELRASALAMGLEDKVVLVTGASRGIGETIAKLFSLHGSRVAINFASSEGHAQRVAREIEAAGGSALTVRADVSDAAQVEAMIGRIIAKWGRIDILVNNAAGDVKPTEFPDVSWNDIQASMNVIARGAFNCCQAVVGQMVAHGGGKIINIGSLATDHPAAKQLKYVMAKSALVGLTRSLAVDYAAKNIQVNLVAPSVVETDLISHIPDAYRAKIAQETPMRRNATPADVAQAVVYLASSYSRFMTGQKIMITGGAAPLL